MVASRVVSLSRTCQEVLDSDFEALGRLLEREREAERRYRGISLIGNPPPVRPYRSPMPRDLRWS